MNAKILNYTIPIILCSIMAQANLIVSTFPNNNDKNVRAKLIKIIEKGDKNKLFHNKHPFSPKDKYTYKTIKPEIQKIKNSICKNKKYKKVIQNNHKVNYIYSSSKKVTVVSVDSCKE